MAHGMSGVSYIEGMRLTERERAVLIELMKKTGIAERRRHPRMVIEGGLSFLCTMDFPGGSSAHFKIYPWDVSKSGLGFFHRAYLYPGTKCTFTGQTYDHQPFSVKGDVTTCSHVSGNVHTVGVKLEFEIDPEMLLGEAAASAAPTPSASPADVPKDWWSQLALHSEDLARLARERAHEEVIRKKVTSLTDLVASCPTSHSDTAGSAAA